MTVLNGNILFNSGSGSDSAASGSALVASENGTGASITSGSAVVTGITTTGVVPGDLFWCNASTGRQFSPVNTVDNGSQVTLDDNMGATESGRDWGIGGKRATFENVNSRKLFSSDFKGSWTAEYEDDQDLTTALSLGISSSVSAGWQRIIGTPGARRKIRQTGSGQRNINLSGNFWEFQNCRLTQSGASKNVAIAGNGNYHLSLIDVEIGDAVEQVSIGLSRESGGPTYRGQRVWIHDTTGVAINSGNSSFSIHLTDGVISYCGGSAFNGFGSVTFDEVLVHNNVGHGLKFDGAGSVNLQNSTFHGNGQNGMWWDQITTTARVYNCQITGNGSYGMFFEGGDGNVVCRDFNNYGFGVGIVNSSGALSHGVLAPNEIEVDPLYQDLLATPPRFEIGTPTANKGTPIVGQPIAGVPNGTQSTVQLGGSKRTSIGAGGGNQAKLKRHFYIAEGLEN